MINGGITIDSSFQVIFLVALLDKYFSWVPHMNYSVKNRSSQLFFIRNLSKKINLENLRNLDSGLFQCSIQYILEYCWLYIIYCYFNFFTLCLPTAWYGGGFLVYMNKLSNIIAMLFSSWGIPLLFHRLLSTRGLLQHAAYMFSKLANLKENCLICFSHSNQTLRSSNLLRIPNVKKESFISIGQN